MMSNSEQAQSVKMTKVESVIYDQKKKLTKAIVDSCGSHSDSMILTGGGLGAVDKEALQELLKDKFGKPVNISEI